MKKCLVSCLIITIIAVLFVPFSNVKANDGTLAQISIWSTDGGKVAAQYTPSDPNTENLPTLDGTVYWDNLTSVQFYVGDEVTAKAEANQSYQFAGWFQADIDYQEGSTEHPRKYKGNPLSTNLSYTYQPGVTVSESNETIWYVCAVFRERISVIEEIVPGDVESEEVPPSTDLADYINSKRWDISTTDSDLNNRWQALFVAENDVYSYPKQGNVTYVFLRQEIHETDVTNYYRIEYTRVDVTHAPENNDNEDKVISLLDIRVDIPRLGEDIHIEEAGNPNTQGPQTNIEWPGDAHYDLDGEDNINYMNFYEEDGTLFEGKFEKDKNYYMDIHFKAAEGYTFSEDVRVLVNGKDAEVPRFSEEAIGVKFEFTPTVNPDVEYTITNGDAEATFTYEEGHDFELVCMDVLKLSAEQIEELGVSPEDFNQILELIKSNTKDIGTLISVYAIEIDGGRVNYTGEVKFRMKMTDEMKQFNSFKFVYLDDENNFKVCEIADFSVDGEYITGTLPHLSAYALVGNVVETNEATTNKTSNPKTGDNIIIYVSILAISTIGIVATIIHKKKKKEN